MNAPAAKPLRQTMPTVAAWIDELREAFGTEQINLQIKDGIAGHPTFYACENGQEVGTKLPDVSADSVKLSETQVGPMALQKKERN